MNSRYYISKIGWYMDLIPSGKSAWVQSPAATMAGFWPVAAKVARPKQVTAMIRDSLENPAKFGGLFPSSVPKDKPYYDDEGGHCWRVGGWPSDLEMISRALKEAGFRAEAALLTTRELSAISVASQGLALSLITY